MLPRVSSYLLAIVATLIVCPAHAQVGKLEAPLQLCSIEWLVASNDVIVRGVVVDVTPDDSNWTMVTLNVLETLKGDKAEQVKFAVHKLEKSDAVLAQARQSKRELLWILRSLKSGVPGEAPDRERAMARHKVELHAPFLPGRPGEPTLPIVPLGSGDGVPAPVFLTIDLQVLRTSNELVKAIRSAIPEAKVRSYSIIIPAEFAVATGFSRPQNQLTVPVDHRLEAFARRLVLTPGDVDAGNNRQLLRMEGVKAMRLFPSEKNMAVIRAWLDDPTSTQPYTVSPKPQTADIIPALPKSLQAERKASLPVKLADVPEIQLQQPLTKAMPTTDAQLHVACTIDSVHMLNQKRRDGFIEELMKKHSDLAGLSFAMGNKCRMTETASRQFVAALDVFHKAPSEDPKKVMLFSQYKKLATEQNVEKSARVASLMQVLAHEEVDVRLGLVSYLTEMTDASATRSLAKLAIFSAEPQLSSAAVKALKTRAEKDYAEILVAGLKYPWPDVAQRAADAIAKLGCKDLASDLVDVLEEPDPRAPKMEERGGKKVPVVRELVRLNHHHNCLLCHAPATNSREETPKEVASKLEGLTAQVPVPSESMVAYYRPSVPDILVRFDVTYLRQDFSLKMPVANADPWPDMQRYDFLVRTREVSDKEAVALQEMLKVESPYRLAAVAALRELTGLEMEPTASAWRKALQK